MKSGNSPLRTIKYQNPILDYLSNDKHEKKIYSKSNDLGFVGNNTPK